MNQTIELTRFEEWFDVNISTAKAVWGAAANLLPSLVQIQDRIREDFGWGIEKDRKSIHHLIDTISSIDCIIWQQDSRSRTLEHISRSLQTANRVVIVGAAVDSEELQSCMKPGDILLVADGAVGVFSEFDNPEDGWSKLAAVVSDADGHPYLDSALHRQVPLVLHAHGDNVENWNNLLGNNQELPPPIVLTHQCPEIIEGAINPGGFTDGDRAISLAIYLGIRIEDIFLCGFRTKEVGKWSGNTNFETKSRKLEWMAEVIELSGVKWSDNHDS